MDDENRRTAVIISSHVALLEPLVEQGGFAVVGAAETVVNGERLVSYYSPAVIVLDNDLPFEQGVQAIQPLRSLSPASRVVLVVNEHWSSGHTSSLGTSVVIGRDELVTLAARLQDVDSVIDLTGEARVVHERRLGRDRRIEQDWSKVGWERRSAVRRADDSLQPVS